MNIKRIKLNLKDLDKENFETVIKAFYNLPEVPAAEKRLARLRSHDSFNLKDGPIQGASPMA